MSGLWSCGATNNPPGFYSSHCAALSQSGSGSRVNRQIIKTNSKAGLPRTPHYFALLTWTCLGRAMRYWHWLYQSVIFQLNPPNLQWYIRIHINYNYSNRFRLLISEWKRLLEFRFWLRFQGKLRETKDKAIKPVIIQVFISTENIFNVKYIKSNCFLKCHHDSSIVILSILALDIQTFLVWSHLNNRGTKLDVNCNNKVAMLHIILKH